MSNLTFVEIRPPRLSGIDASEVRKFIGQWLDYKRDIREREVHGGAGLPIRRLAACIEESTLEYLIEYELGVGHTRNNVTDDCLEECLRNIVKRFQISASEAVELLRRRVRYDLRVKDPYARVGQMFRTLAEVTRLYGLEDVWKIFGRLFGRICRPTCLLKLTFQKKPASTNSLSKKAGLTIRGRR